MARTPEQDDVFLREVDDAVRQDQVADAARRFGPLIAVAVVIILGGFGGWIWYQQHAANVAGRQGEVYVQALDRIDAGNAKVAAGPLAELTKTGDEAYSAAARFTQANIALAAGDAKRATGLLGAIAADTQVPQSFRDLATVRKTAIEFDSLTPAAIVARLKPLTATDSPWFATASEMTAIAHLRLGQRAEAGRIFADISAAKGVEPSLQSRSVQMAGMLGVDAVTDANVNAAPAAQPTG